MINARNQRGYGTSLVLTAVLSAVLFYSGFFTFFFAVPVQVAYSRHGNDRGMMATGAAAALILVMHIVNALRVTGATSLSLVLIDVLMPMGMLGGLLVYNVVRRYPWWMRLLAGGAIALVAAIPSLRIIAMLGQDNGEMVEQFNSMLTLMGVEQNREIWADLVRRIVLSSVGLALTAGIAANWWLGNGIVRRTDGVTVSLRTARLPEQLVWMVIAGLAIIVISWAGASQRFAPIGWNLALVGGFLFAIQGVGLIQHLLHRRGVGFYGERWVLTIILLALFIPGINVLVAGGLPLFGMSEVWIDYKRGVQYEGNSEQ